MNYSSTESRTVLQFDQLIDKKKYLLVIPKDNTAHSLFSQFDWDLAMFYLTLVALVAKNMPFATQGSFCGIYNAFVSCVNVCNIIISLKSITILPRGIKPTVTLRI